MRVDQSRFKPEQQSVEGETFEQELIQIPANYGNKHHNMCKMVDGERRLLLQQDNTHKHTSRGNCG